MSILIGRDTRLVVQGITGREGEFHSRAMLEYGTPLVAGMTPGKGGQTALDGRVPVFNTVSDAVRETGANTSCIFVPAGGAPDAVLEAVDAGIATIFCITEGIPALDMVPVVEVVRRAGARLIGPNCPGATSPGRAKVGIIPGSIHREGRVGVVSRSGTLTYEAVQAMTDAGLGQSTCVGIGGDPVIGTQFLDILELFAADPETEALVLIGEIGGAAEEEAAAWAAEHMADVPRVAFIAGRTAPEGKRMGHAGAIISGGRGTAASKVDGARGRRASASPALRPSCRRCSARPATGADRARSTTSATCSPTTAGRRGGSWPPSTACPRRPGAPPGSIGDRGLGAILVHQLGAHQRWRFGLSGRATWARAPSASRSPRPPASWPALGGRVGRARRLARRR